MKDRGTFATHEVLRWGVENFYNSADRVKRTFMEQGFIRRMSNFEKEMSGVTSKDAVYTINRKAIDDYLQPRLFYPLSLSIKI